MICADGFLPVIIEDESLGVVTGGDGRGDISVRYFPYCPPESEATTEAIRHCSDPITTVPVDSEAEIDNEESFAICGDRHTRIHTRRMKSRVLMSISLFGGITLTEKDSFLCCDSILDDEANNIFDNKNDTSIATSPLVVGDDIATDSLDESECVPYQNNFYESVKVQNRIGWLSPIICDFPEGDFLFPRSFGEGNIDDIASTGRYQCCVIATPMPSFVQDSAFKITLYPLITLYCVAAVVSATMAVGLLIPLLIQLKKKKTDQELMASSTFVLSGKFRS